MNQLSVVSEDEFERIRTSLVCVHNDQFERDMEIIFDEYMQIFNYTKCVPSMSELENSITAINWSISYDMAEYLTMNADEYISDLEDCIKGDLERKGNISRSEREEVMGESRHEFISELCGELFDDLYWYNTQEIRDNIRQALMEMFLVYVDDLADNPTLYNIFEYMDSHHVYANNAQMIMFRDMYDWEYGEDCLIPTDRGHICNHIIQRKDGYVKEKLMLEHKEVSEC